MRGRSNSLTGILTVVSANSGNLAQVLQVNDTQFASLATPHFGAVGTLSGQIFPLGFELGACLVSRQALQRSGSICQMRFDDVIVAVGLEARRACGRPLFGGLSASFAVEGRTLPDNACLQSSHSLSIPKKITSVRSARLQAAAPLTDPDLQPDANRRQKEQYHRTLSPLLTTY
ncbi:hypothetical protein AS026_29630 [Rhizobium altiplani]|uniref:Uncharacterized protein n=2 Tax=Rhizobium TaxID=379 RepID=K0Q4S7_9HYPH|nr:hypothetical protein AS026_29630 [Rhizobium altiplani]CCM80170.1 exported hypothetical protein [Rhizobium mesoamericanum STM3625]